MAVSACASTSNLERGEYHPVNAMDSRLSDAAPSHISWRALKAGFAVGAVLGCAALAAAAVGHHRAGVQTKFDGTPETKVDAASADAVAAGLGPVEAGAHHGGGVWNAWGKSVVDTAVAAAAADGLLPGELRHDGNPCEDNEEPHAGLCYKKCELLSDGQYPVRCSAFTCAGSHPCTLENQHFASEIPGEGYDVNGLGGWPHAPGACLTDEELFLGVCYKKCSLLTHGTFNHRTAAATCCKEEGWGCLDFLEKDWTNAAFDVGGGAGDHDKSTPGLFHVPIKNLTEGTGPLTQAPDIPSIAKSHFAPDDDRHDNNTCEDNEELYLKLCYKKCSILTDGEYPIRGTAFSCCKEEPCGIINQQMDGFVPCAGYDVSGTGGCPHKSGACLLDEEFFLGLCYKKCSILTKGTHPFRSTVVSCCKDDGLDCFNPFGNASESADYLGVAGGSKDHNLGTPGYAHPPVESLTEV